jgi:hypothetical protein
MIMLRKLIYIYIDDYKQVTQHDKTQLGLIEQQF